MLLIVNGTLYTPAPRGRATILVAGGRIERIGDVDARAFDPEILDASGCIVAPGLIDPHAHLIGGSGERGFASATPALSARELLEAGITTVVGTLGTDTTTRTLPTLLAKVKALREEGLNTRMWTGGYDARSITASVRDDIVLIEEIIGAGEIAIADPRAAHFDARALARLASDCHVAGMLTGKAGVLHLHTGHSLGVLHTLLDEFAIPPAALYPTHVNRTETTMREGMDLAARGVAIDLDVVEENLPRWLRRVDVDPSRITISTDAPIGRPGALLEQIRAVIREGILPVEQALALATRNPARVLKLQDAGGIAEGARADVLLLDEDSLALRNVIAGGRIVYP